MAVRHEARLVHSRFLPAAKRTRSNPPCAGARVRTRSDAPDTHKVRTRYAQGTHKARTRPSAHKVKKSQNAQGRTLSPEVANAQGAHKVLTDMVWEQ